MTPNFREVLFTAIVAQFCTVILAGLSDWDGTAVFLACASVGMNWLWIIIFWRCRGRNATNAGLQIAKWSCPVVFFVLLICYLAKL